MILKAKDVTGLKVMTLDEGKFVEKVKDIVYDPKTNEVLALLISEGGWFSDAKVILFKDIHSIGDDAVVIKAKERISKASEVEKRVKDIAKSDTYLTATKIVTEGGEELGEVSDIYFDSETGKVDSFEVSSGTLKDIQGGKKKVRIKDIVTVGKDATVVHSYTEEVFEEQAESGGVQGTVNKLKEKGSNVIDEAKKDVNKARDRAGEKYQEVKDDPETQNTMDKIRNKAEDLKRDVEKKFEEVRDELPGATERAGNEVKQKVGDVKDSVEQRQMDNAAGQILLKTVYDPRNNEVIGNAGAEVDYNMLRRAKEAGVLGQITGNVERPLQ